MDKIEKALQKLSERERGLIKEILLKIQSGEFRDLDVKKLKGHEGIYRVRKGDIRIIFRRHQGAIFVLAIERRSEKTYRNF